jgi:hypothetical protein
VTALLLLAALLGFLLGGFGVGGSEETETAIEPASVLCGPASNFEPCSSAEIGDWHSVVLQGHCEIEWAYFDGRYWVPASGRSAPSGGEDVVEGVMRMRAEDSAEFQHDSGEVIFVPAAAGYVPPPCA